MTRWFSLLLIGLTLGLSGCAGTFETPNHPNTIGTDTTAYTFIAYQQDLKTYHDEIRLHDYDGATVQRDMMVYNILTDIDWNYGIYKGKLHSGRGEIATVGDAASLGLSAAATVVGGAELKAILAATDTGLKGLNSSYDKNLFAQQTTEILVTSMDALRKTQKTQIIQNITQMNAAKYPFEAARDDLAELFLMGTREAGLAALSADAGKKSVDAQTAAQAANDERISAANLAPHASAQSTQMMQAVRNKIYTLSNDPVNGLKEAKRILGNLGETLPDTATLNDAIGRLNSYTKDAYDSSRPPTSSLDKLQNLYNAMFK
jgi:hypothetical protein